MDFAYDLHVHTAASPCGDAYMSPNNIINMAKLNKLDIIAITDHNTCANCEVVMKIGKEKGILVVPGMEIECMEEFHCVTLFPNLQAARYVEEQVIKHMPLLKNRIDIFGNQSILDENDEVIGEIERLLLTATQIPINQLIDLVDEVGGVIYPAHIDRNAYSILSNLGEVPEDLHFRHLEISKKANLKLYMEKYSKYHIIQSSDAHYLQDIHQNRYFLSLNNLDISTLMKSLKFLKI